MRSCPGLHAQGFVTLAPATVALTSARAGAAAAPGHPLQLLCARHERLWQPRPSHAVRHAQPVNVAGHAGLEHSLGRGMLAKGKLGQATWVSPAALEAAHAVQRAQPVNVGHPCRHAGLGHMTGQALSASPTCTPACPPLPVSCPRSLTCCLSALMSVCRVLQALQSACGRGAWGSAAT